jgi:glycine/D-amino acid oxidase-like deaminating enzyme
VATNAYTGHLTPGLRRRIIPIQSQIIATEPLDPDLAAGLIPRGRIVFDTKRMLYYYRVTADRRMLFGGRATFTPVSPARSGAILRRHLFALYPQLRGVRVDFAWSGVVGFTFDLDRRMEGLHYSMGYCGHGVALGTYLGHRMGELIAGTPVDLPFLELPFPTHPLYRGFPWFLPLADLGYRLLDRVR